mgnify:FL=1
MGESATVIQLLFNLFLWMMMLLIFKKAFYFPYRIKRTNRNVAIFLILIFCLYPFFGGDYFHYRQMYNEFNAGGFIPLEKIYQWIIGNLSFSYLSFRLIVWGAALWLLFKAYKRVTVPFDLCLALFASMFMIWFSYARVSLAMAMILFGMTFVIRPAKRMPIVSVIVGVSLILCSEFFHRSAIIGIAAAFGALLLTNADKKRILLIGLLFPVAILILTKLLDNFMTIDLDYDTFITGNQRDGYLNDTETGRHSRGIGELISNFLTRTPMFLVAFLYLYIIFKNKYMQLPKDVRYIASYAFIIVLIATAFSFDLGFNTYVLFYRTLTFAMVPSAVFIASVREIKFAKNLTELIVLIGISGVAYTLLYSTYCAIVG